MMIDNYVLNLIIRQIVPCYFRGAYAKSFPNRKTGLSPHMLPATSIATDQNK